VQFQLDGANLGSALTSAPYNLTWNSASYPNGSHTLRAIARDAAGNQTTSASVTVTVNNIAASAPTVSVVASVPNAVLGTTNYGAFTFTRTGSTASPLNVNYTLGGTAVKWNDYYRLGVGDMPVVITIPAGSASYTMGIVARDNQTHSNPETVKITLSPDATYLVGTPSTATMTIVSNAPPVVVNPNPVTVTMTKVWNGMKLTWNSVAGKIYRISYTNALNGTWGDLSGNITATTTSTSWIDTSALPAQRYYRVYSIN